MTFIPVTSCTKRSMMRSARKRRARPQVREMMMRQHKAEVVVASETITVPQKVDMAQMPGVVAGVSSP
jgi:hypothetical protein